MRLSKAVPGEEVLAHSEHDCVEIRVRKHHDIVSGEVVRTVDVLVDADTSEARWVGMSWKEGPAK